MDLPSHVNAFTRFATGFLTGDAYTDYHIQLKIDHTLRVLENGQAIAKGEGLPEEIDTLCQLGCLYHDIGRFPQFARYNTFKDADSTNHGRLGVLTMRELDLPVGPTQSDWTTIRAAIGLHNVKRLNPRLRNPLATVTKVVRDADKIDIYPVILKHLGNKDDATKVVIHHLEDAPEKYSASVLETILASKTVDYGQLVYANDFILLTTGWIFTLNYATSIPLFARDNLVDMAFSILPKNKTMQSLKNKVDHFIHYNSSPAS